MSKLIIPRSELPAVGKNGVYTMRFRIVSDDRNTFSAWTPIFNVVINSDGNKFVKDAVMANVYHQRIGSSEPKNYNIYLSWHDPDDLGFYDIYTKWHSANGWTDWIKLTTTSSRNFSFNPPMYLVDPSDPETHFDAYGVSVTRPNYHGEYVPELALFSTENMPNGISLV